MSKIPSALLEIYIFNSFFYLHLIFNVKVVKALSYRMQNLIEENTLQKTQYTKLVSCASDVRLGKC
jgi:hypothetical protein